MKFGFMSHMRGIFSVIKRELVRNTGSVVVNAIGLSLTVAVVLHIAKVVQFETSFDSESASTYRVWMETWRDGNLQTSDGATYPAVANILQTYSEVQSVSRSIGFTGSLQTTQIDGRDIVLKSAERIWTVEPAFLDIFPINMIEGDASLENPFEVIVSDRIAETYFSGRSPVGHVIEEDGEDPFVITGVFESRESQSFFKPDFIRSYTSLAAHFENLTGNPTTIPIDSWDWPRIQMYIKLRDGIDKEHIQQKLTADIAQIKQLRTGDSEQYYLQDVSNMHLTSVQNEPFGTPGPTRKRLDYAIYAACLIVLIASINFFNLLLSNNIARAREVGVRTIIGADRGTLFRLFFIENCWLIYVSFLVGMMLFELSSPLLAEITNQTIPGLEFMDIVLLTTGATGFAVIASLFPVVILMRSKPSHLIKGSVKPAGTWMKARSLFTAIQFGITMFLLITVFVVYQQVSFMLQKEPGFELEQVLVVKGPRNFDYEEFSANPDYIKNALRNLAHVEDVTSSYSVPGNRMSAYELRRVGASEPAGRFYSSETDKNYLQFFGVEFLAGRNFSEDTEADYHTVILNESALNQFGFASPEEALGQWITSPEQDNNREIIGIVRDIHHLSLHQGFLPTTYSLDPESRGFYSVKVNTREPEGLLEQVKSVFDTVFAGNDFEYFFLEDSFYDQYTSDKAQGKVLALLFGISILLSCIGLFAMAALVINSRLREVGIRKVLGATVQGLFGLITFRFLKLIVISALIVMPGAWLLLNQWLDNYAFRISISYWMLVAPLVITLLLALLTISYQTITVALINPVDTIREE